MNYSNPLQCKKYFVTIFGISSVVVVLIRQAFSFIFQPTNTEHNQQNLTDCLCSLKNKNHRTETN